MDFVFPILLVLRDFFVNQPCRQMSWLEASCLSFCEFVHHIDFGTRSDAVYRVRLAICLSPEEYYALENLSAPRLRSRSIIRDWL